MQNPPNAAAASAEETNLLGRYHRELAWVFALCLAVLISFWPVLEADFLAWDDDINIYENPRITALNAENLAWMFADFEHALRYKPLSWLSWAIIHQFSGLHPFGYHFANLLLHCVNTVLVFVLLRQLALRVMGEIAVEKLNYVSSCAAAGTAFWALNPLRVESVAWATALPYGQALLFLLLSLLSYLRYCADVATRVKWYWAAVVCFALALLTYPTVLGFLGVLVLLDFWPLKRLERMRAFAFSEAQTRRVWLEKVPFLALTTVFVLGTLYGRAHATGDWPEPKSLTEYGLTSRVMQGFYVWAYYLWKPLWPMDLAPMYTTFLYFKPFDAAFLVSLVAVLGISLGALAGARRLPLLMVLWFAHLALLVPVLGLTERPHYHHDRYSLIEGICWAGLITAGLMALGQRKQFMKPAGVVCAAGMIALATLSHRQTAIWQNNIVFLEYLVTKLDDTAYRSTAYLKLGNVYLGTGDEAKATNAFRQSIALNPGFAKPHFNLANVLAGQKKFDEAVPLFREAIRLDPKHVGARNNLAIVLAELGRLDEAAALVNEALQLEPDNADLHYNQAQILQKQGRTAEAAAHYQRADRLKNQPR
ncbi:MAG: tetratricopeptide repeat protein [Verrucomicrobiota bacterium]